MTDKVVLLPCPWCDSTDIRIYVGDGVRYAQCHNCTACGPDHKNGRHWNSVAEELKRLLRYAIEHSSARILFPDSFVEDAKRVLGL